MIDSVMAVFEQLSQQLHATFGVQIAAEHLLVDYVMLLGLTLSWICRRTLKTNRKRASEPPIEYVDPDTDPNPESDGECERRSRPPSDTTVGVRAHRPTRVILRARAIHDEEPRLARARATP